MALVPFIGLMAMCAWVITEQLERWQNAAVVDAHLAYAPAFSRLAHELQKERGLSAGYLGSGGSGNFADLLQTQRIATDQANTDLRASLINDPASLEHAMPVLHMVDTLTELRTGVSQQSRSVAQMAKAYTGIIVGLLDEVASVVHDVSDVHSAHAAAAYVAALNAKELAGRERAVGAAGFGKGSFTAEQHKTFLALAAKQDALFAETKSRAGGALAAALTAALEGAEAQEVARLRAIGYDSITTADLRGITGPEWFAASTARIDRLKEVEDLAAAELLAAAGEHATNSMSTLVLVIVIAGAMALVCLVVSIVNVRSLKGPLSSIVDNITNVSKGNTDILVGAARRSDELGDIGRALEVMRDSEVERKVLVAQERERLLREDARNRRIATRIAEFEQTAQETLEDLYAMSEAMEGVAHNLAQTADNTAQDTNAAKTSSDQATQAVMGVANAIDQLHSSIDEISARVEASRTATDEAASTVSQTSARVNGLANAAEAINNVASMIAGIAEQTNLLALNATIEAERAGPAGRGFAVVATEVKELADQTAAATSQIAKQIEDIQSETRAAVQGIDDILSRFDALRSSALGISSVMSQQSAATRDIGEGMKTASDGSQTAAESVRGVSDAVERTSDGAHRVQDAAARMNAGARKLQKVFADFLTEVRTA